MIQRIQTIYLFLASIFAIIFIFSPYAFSGVYTLNTSDNVGVSVLSGLIAAVSLISIFLFRNRPLQMNICKLNIVLVLGLVALAIYSAYLTEGNDTPAYGAVFPALALLGLFLAFRGVKADHNLVRSVNRLR